jgi:hypothetical protein
MTAKSKFLSVKRMHTKKIALLLTVTLGCLCIGIADAKSPNGVPKQTELWSHLSSAKELTDARGMSARFDDSGNRRVLNLNVPQLNLPLGEHVRDPSSSTPCWIAVPPPAKGWKLGNVQNIEAKVKNAGTRPAKTTLWVVSSNGWAAVGNAATLGANQETTLRCDLRETYPDGTPKIDPGRIKQIRVMVERTAAASLVVSDLVATGTADDWVRPARRLDVPDMGEGKPAAGRRVRYQLASDANNDIYCALSLPPDWKPGKRYPVIAEYPGNIWFSAKSCWSTGRPEQCVMGYGISAGTSAIWVSLPFVDGSTREIDESGFGSNDGDDTTHHTMAVIEDVCANWGGDRNNLFLCGFSRGGFACDYIGLRNDKIAQLWKGFVACQGSYSDDAVERAPRFSGKAIFQIDNRQARFQPVVDATKQSVEWTWTKSGLRYHATAMFLDDRPVMKQLRRWFRDLTMK